MTLPDIGEGKEALFCITNKTNCCRVTDIRNNDTLIPSTIQNLTGIGQWYFPNSTLVGGKSSQGALYRSRGLSVVRLNRMKNAMTPTGLFHCVIEDADEVNISIYIGIYLSENGILNS